MMLIVKDMIMDISVPFFETMSVQPIRALTIHDIGILQQDHQWQRSKCPSKIVDARGGHMAYGKKSGPDSMCETVQIFVWSR